MVDITTCIPACAITSEYMGWMEAIAIILSSVLLLLSIIYIAGRVMNRREWEALAKLEVYQTFMSAILVIIVAALAISSCSIACQISGGDNPFDIAIGFLKSTQTSLEGHMTSLLDIARSIRISSAVMLVVPPGQVMVRPLEGCAFIASNFENSGMLLAPFVASLVVQQVALWMIAKIAFLMILPVGIILRIIPFAREAGAFLIALAISLYIIFPLTYVFASKAFDGVSASYSASIQGPGESGNTASRLLGVSADCADPSVAQVTLTGIGYTLPAAVFIPALAMIITIGAARVLTKVFMNEFK